MNMERLHNKISLVTGSNRGIGKAIVELFHDEGAIVYAGMRNLDANPFKGINGVIPVELDVCNDVSIKNCIKRIKNDCGQLDVLVNNAGIVSVSRLEMTSEQVCIQLFETNVYGIIRVTQASLRLLKKTNSASIVNISSVLGLKGDIGQTCYGATKAAVINMTTTWAKEFAEYGIRVNAIAPGNIDTDMYGKIDEEGFRKDISRTLLGRLGKPIEIANIAVFLASDMSSYITGESIRADGGLIL